ncbi:hypothetical protein M231_04502 [Tremella mesenterica]|uniref:RING-type E3 ubiquitin transferase n=1 Tax=Tremella mesenterica TaxID=5217 RepID=A0A4Q1BKA7_TREME|nr:hypothetical protein M231_04502 [Tremella mesenterica]
MSRRLAAYGLASTALAGVVVTSAIKSRPNFFSAAVAVGRSSGALMILGNFALFNVICLGIALKTIFFGRLRPIEYEHLFERLWLFLTESLLALTIFRDDFNAPFAIMYSLLLFLKCFHWITADRVDYMDQIPPPGPPISYHLRISSIISLLTAVDMILVIYSLETIILDGPSAMILFASEFMILLASISGTFARYMIGLIDLRRARGRADAPSWEEKSMYLFYIDLAVDFTKLLTYLSFFAVILMHYGLPLHILRDVYMTLRSFLSRCGDLIRYRRATRDMDALYPNATAEELERSGDRTCIICREEMIAAQEDRAGNGGPNETPKKLACGHVFHFHCLRSWLERQQSCPTCRRDVLRTAPTRPSARPGRPAPPAPGAIPQVNAGPNNNQPLRAAYEDFFRFAQNPDQPTPAGVPPPRQGAAIAADLEAAADAQFQRAVQHTTPVVTTNAAEANDSVDGQIQRSIWGSRVVPGQFFPPLLGATPRSSQSTPVRLSTGLAPTPRPSLGGMSSNRVRLQPPERVANEPLVNPSQTSQDQTPNVSGPSGATTPFHSNPPVIFTSTGAVRPPLGPAPAAPNGIENDARRVAAEAGMRRSGLVPPGELRTRPSSPLEPSTISPHISATNPDSTIPPFAVNTASDNPSSDTASPKGKQRAIPDDWDAQPLHIPLLSPLSSQPLIRPTTSWGRHPVNVREALDDRLRLLRDVDEVVWGLIGELSRAKSAWEGEDQGVSSDNNGSGTGEG